MKNEKRLSANEMVPGDIFHPGEHLKDELDARGMSQQELADKTHMGKSEISMIIHGHRNITPLIAIKLEQVLGPSAEFWMNLQVKYEIDEIKRRHMKALSKSRIVPIRKTRIGKLISAAPGR